MNLFLVDFSSNTWDSLRTLGKQNTTLLFIGFLICSITGCATRPFYCDNPIYFSQSLACIIWDTGTTGRARAEAKNQEEIERLAKEGDVEAQFQLGTNLFNNNHAESWKWFCRAAMSGHEGAQAVTGLFYEYGLDPVEANSVTALMWYRLAGKVGEKQAKKLESEIKTDQIINANQLAQQWQPSDCIN